MSILRRLFGHSSRDQIPESDAILGASDLLMARDEIADMHQMTNKQAEREGGAYYYSPEYAAAWQTFRANPTAENARALVRVAPPLLKLL